MAIKEVNIDFSVWVITPLTEKEEARLVELKAKTINQAGAEKDERDSLIMKQLANIQKGLIDDWKFPEFDFQHNISARQYWAIYLVEKENFETNKTANQVKNGVERDIIRFV